MPDDPSAAPPPVGRSYLWPPQGWQGSCWRSTDPAGCRRYCDTVTDPNDRCVNAQPLGDKE